METKTHGCLRRFARGFMGTSDKVTGHIALGTWEPGNGTSYRITVMYLSPELGDGIGRELGSFVLGWLDGSSSGRTMVTTDDPTKMPLQWHLYVAEKMGINDADAVQLRDGWAAIWLKAQRENES